MRLPNAAGNSSQAEGPKVLAVFERSCYAGLGSNLLMCVGLSDIGRAPLNLLLDLPRGTTFQRLGLQKGDPLGKSGSSLTVGPLRILLGEAEIWTPPRPPMADMSCESLLDRLRWLTAALELHPDPPGLGPLARTAAWDDNSLSLPPLAARALPYAQSLAEGLVQGEVTLLRKGASGLVGLGPGLTPSGDDFLGGWLTTLRCTEGKGGFSSQELDRAATEIRSLARGKTPAISEALLNCALAGDSSEPIHILLNQVLSQPPPPAADTLAHSVREVTRHGHSSGWDALAGIVWGFQSLIKRLRATEPHDRIRISRHPALR